MKPLVFIYIFSRFDSTFYKDIFISMNENSSIPDLDSLFEGFNLSDVDEGDTEEYRTLSFWFPVEYKEKYDLLQKRSKNKFGKLIKALIMRSIDKVPIEEKAC